jgi:protein-S-isoprenylcysteine O-methyltransferase Ste14
MPTIYTIIAYWSWIVLFIVWLPGYFTGKRTIQRPNPVRRVVAMLFIIAAFIFLFSNQAQSTAIQITPQTVGFGIAGLMIDLFFVGFAIWARVTLGKNWSNAIALKEGHELVQRGPYAIVRHPIYTGMLFAVLGVALTLGSLSGYIAVVLFLVGVLIRIRDEDALMARQFPSEHAAYRARTKALVPFVW